MAEMTRNRKRIAVFIVVVGLVLIAQRVDSLVSGEAESAATATAALPKRATRDAKASDLMKAKGQGARAAVPPEQLHLDRLDARQLALIQSVQPHTRSQERTLFDSTAAPMAMAKTMPEIPKPTAPPFGYAYMGGLLDEGLRTAFFTQGERLITVKVGDTVDAAYRIEQMTDKQMTLTYLPLNETVVVALGGRP